MNTTSTSYFRKTLPAFLLLTAALALCSATVVRAATVSNWLSLTITNPTPEIGDWFGRSVAAVGTDRVLIGAPRDDTGGTDAGAVYLFNTNGVLLTTFTNPTPVGYGNFGVSVALVGADCVLIGADRDDVGATDAGAAYLFSTNGALLTTFTNPTPASDDLFGISLAVVGTDRVLIGAPYDDTGATDAGAAYLFSTNGVLLITFTKPTPEAYDQFGTSVAALGTDRVLIGAVGDDTASINAGAAYLFSTNSVLLTSFTNPTPAANDWFGRAVLAVGSDCVLIGAPRDDSIARDAGAAYLFSTNGAMLATFVNSQLPTGGYFGISVAAVGTDRVLIGMLYDGTGAGDGRAACLFSTNGDLLATFTKPTPATFDYVGSAVVAVGTDQVLIGTPFDDTGATDAGAAYLFSIETITPPAPSLSANRNPSLSPLTISWPAPAEGWLLEGTNALPSVPASSWPPVPPPYQTNAGTISVTLTNLPAAGNQFFRLRQP